MTNNVHQQFAEYFEGEHIKPYLYLLSKKMEEGHICIDIKNVDEADLDELYSFSKKSIEKDLLVSDGSEIKPLILSNNLLYFQRYYHYETMILERIKLFLEEEKEVKDQNLEWLIKNCGFIQGLFSSVKSDDINWQKAAAIISVLNQFTIITGGPGTGKTTTVAQILYILFSINSSLKVALAAPTGKAATRMAESLKNAASNQQFGSKIVGENFNELEPTTIHRLLGSRKNSIYFKHNKSKPVNYDVVIIDESSMLDVALFAKLLDAIGPQTKLILLGDKDQLASVEAGSLFGDLCIAQKQLNIFSKETVTFINSFNEDEAQHLSKYNIGTSDHPLFGHIVQLQKSYRFSDDTGIGKFSRAITSDDSKVIKSFFKNEDPQVIIDPEYSDKIFKNFISGYDAFIKEKDISLALQKLNDLKLLCAIRDGEQGLYALNKKIENYLQQKRLINSTVGFYENRPVMMTENNYELGLFNGDVGLVRPNDNNELRIWFDQKGELKPVLPSSVSGVETVFAMTIHKSQGSEFEKILVILPEKKEIEIITRELLYTAVTRAKKQVIIQASEEVILNASAQSVKRGSGIMERFTK